RGMTLAAETRRTSRGLEAKSLSLLAEAIVALNETKHDVAGARIQAVITDGVWDPLVIAIRAAPYLGKFIAEQAQLRPRLQRLLVASRDASIAASLGLRVPRAAKEKTSLSPRETEVHELLAQGLTNEEIANLLFISLSTTKVHVKHIFEKLGVRS